MQQSDYLRAGEVLAALWPVGRPSPKPTEAERIEARAIMREVSLEEWETALRGLASEDRGSRFRPSMSEIRAACKVQVRKRARAHNADAPAPPDRPLGGEVVVVAGGTYLTASGREIKYPVPVTCEKHVGVNVEFCPCRPAGP